MFISKNRFVRLGLGPSDYHRQHTPVAGRVLESRDKGDEISYFQFGGSDIVMVFEAAANVHFTATVGQHYKYGRAIANAYPVTTGLGIL